MLLRVLLFIAVLPAAFAERDVGTTSADPAVVKEKWPQWVKACETNDGFACGNMGAAYAAGKGVEKSDARAFFYYERACRFGQGFRCLGSGMLALNGRGTADSALKAAELFGLGCRALDVSSCVNYYSVTHGKKIDFSGAVTDRPAGFVSPPADPKILQSVLNVLSLACTKDVPGSCGNLAGIYEEGDAAPRDLVKALGLYQIACKQGEAERCARAGRYFANGVGTEGLGVASDNAARMFERYCELSSFKPCLIAEQAKLGQPIYLKLPNLPPVKPPDAPTTTRVPLAVAPKDTPPWARYPISYSITTEGLSPEAAELVRACNKGNARACGNAGALLVDTAGKPKLFPEVARQLFERACGLGRAQRCADLARFHANGWGTDISSARERAALLRACELGNKPSCNLPQPAK